MNWLDILLIVIFLIMLVGTIVSLIMGIKEDDYFFAGFMGPACALWIGICLACFIVLDKASGSTIGKIMTVDKNFFGTTAVYVKTSETEQWQFCVEDKDVIKQANKLIGKTVKVEYGKRVGIYSTGRCHSSPLKKIVEVKENE